MSIPTFGQSGFGKTVFESIPKQYPITTTNFVGPFADVNFSASIYAALGWRVTLSTGTPATMVATIQCELSNDGLTPISSSGTYNTINWAWHYDTTDKSILHAGVQIIPWISQLTETQTNILEKALSDPPTGSLVATYPQFNTASGSAATGGGPPPIFSSSYGSYTAGDVIWNMGLMGQRTVPINVPTLRYKATVGSGFSLANYNSNLFPNQSVYSAATLISTWGVPANFAAELSTIQNSNVDPPTTLTYGIPMVYGWQKQPPTIDENGITTDIQQEYKFGLYPVNVFGARL